jgi:hypothetical protein
MLFQVFIVLGKIKVRHSMISISAMTVILVITKKKDGVAVMNTEVENFVQKIGQSCVTPEHVL